MKPSLFNQKALLAIVLLPTAFLIATSNVSFAKTANDDQTVDSQINGLGGTPSVVRRAKKLEPQNKVAVVQNRSVDRNWRLELGVNYGMVTGGNSYLDTKSLGASADLHISPRWSVGARYYNFSNALTSEGDQVYKQAVANNSAGTSGFGPSVDAPQDTTLGVVSFYPLYGKINMFDSGIAQFDLYMLGGGGQMRLQSGTTGTWTAGGGVGFWISNHFTTRLEVRYQAYQAHTLDSTQNENTVVSTFAIGFLL